MGGFLSDYINDKKDKKMYLVIFCFFIFFEIFFIIFIGDQSFEIFRYINL